MQKIYQYSIKEEPVSELDWEECSEHAYYDLQGYALVRIIEKESPVNDWDDLWYEFTKTPEYKQSIQALQIRAYVDWLKDNFQAPIKK